MTTQPRHLLAALLILLLAPEAVFAQKRVLFDASHRENAGNADWVIDADAFDLNQPHYPCGPSDFENESRAQRLPTPAPGGITSSTPETYWTGALSAFGIDLVRLGYDVESLPTGAQITFGDAGNPQDLSLYDVFVLPEPNQPFSAGETQALQGFVASGGGLFLITDHQTSDRDCDGFDSPHIGNDLMGVVIDGGTITDFGLFGIVFNVEEIAGQTGDDYWFTDAIDDNVSTDPSDAIIQGPHGVGTGGLGLFGSTSMTLDPASNASVRGHVWKTDAGGQGSTRVTFATATYQDGRIACIGDSSPADDGTGDPGDTLYLGWDRASGGVNNREIHLNAVAWLAGPDTSAPVITSGPGVSVFDCSAVVSWTTDEAADSTVDYGGDTGYGSSATDPALVTLHSLILGPVLPDSLYHFRAASSDGSGNGPTTSPDATFSTSSASPPSIVGNPVITALTGDSATVVWTTDEPASSVVRLGTTPSYGTTSSDPSLTSSHAVTLTGLSPSTLYHFQVESSDGCGHGPALSGDGEFTTSPAAIDLSGWNLLQFDSAQSYVFPPGTTIPAGGYLVLGRDASRTAFETEWGPLPAGTAYLDSQGSFPFINGGESFELRDGGSVQVDGVTISMSSGTTIQRNNPGDPAGVPGSWTVAGSAAGSPGSGAGIGSGAGVVLNEASDANDFHHEFVELYFDDVPPGPDTIAPSAVTDLSAEPRSASLIRLTWTAPGDDASAGTAATYDVRQSNRPIRSDSDFLNATPLSGEPAPATAGTVESWEVTGFASETSYYFAVKTSDEVGNTSDLSDSPGATTGAAGSGTSGSGADHPVISEIRTRGATDHDDEFVELYNPTDSVVNLDGWSLQYKSAGGSNFLRFDLPAASIDAGGYFLVTRPPGEYDGAVAGDVTQSSFLMGASGGHLFLVSEDTSLPSCTDPGIVDQVGYGTADCPEGLAAVAHGAGESLERGPGAGCGNGIDTDDNDADFESSNMPSPRNSTTIEPPCVDLGNVGPSLFLHGDDLQWGAALGAADYKIRRAGSRDFMETHPAPDDTFLLTRIPGTTLTDTDPPPVGTVLFYFVTATDGGSTESVD